VLYVEDCVEQAFRLADYLVDARDLVVQYESYNMSYRLARSVMDLSISDIPLAAIQGPPGSGKTFITELLAEDYIAEELLSTRDLIFYVAPTNELVIQACKRVLARIFRKVAPTVEERCRWVRDIPELVRVLGYKITSNRRMVLKGVCGEGVNVSKMVDLKIDENVKLVFLTEFQRPYIKGSMEKAGGEGKRDIKIIVDEASRSPYFRFFIPIVRRIVSSNYSDYPVALVVLGDPQQAITISEYGRDILLMNVVKKKLEEMQMENHFNMLDVTFRLPAPSHEPISYGYYDGRLNAIADGLSRLGNFNFDSQRILELLNKYEDVSKTDLQKVVYAIEDAISSKTPIIVLDTDKFNEGDTLDPKRAKLGFYASLALSVWLSDLSLNPKDNVAVTSIYSDMPLFVKYAMGRRGLLNIDKFNIATLTVQSMIGDERRFIVTMLGKEYISDITEQYSTLYAREPELLNVQLSRHNGLLIMIGCVDCLSKFALQRSKLGYEKIANTANKLKELINNGDAIYECFKGKGCVK